MNAKLIRLIATLMMTVILLHSTLARVVNASADDAGAKIDLFTQKAPFDGKGFNQSSDAFQPQEMVVLYALLTYNGYSAPNKLVGFQVNNPANAFQNITVVGTSFTNEDGIAQLSFRIPWPYENAEQIIFGKWFAIATADVAGEIPSDTLTFQVGWLIKVTNITTLNAMLVPQTKYAKGEMIVFNLTIENIALTPKLATIMIDVYDAASYPIMHAQKDDVFQPGKNCMYTTSQIPLTATIGNATVSAVAYTAPPEIGGVPCSPPISSQFKIIAPRQYYLTVMTDPLDIVLISGEGWYDEGSSVSLTAPGNVSVSVGVRYGFGYWDVDGTSQASNSLTVTMNANHTATAHYTLQYYLTVRTDPLGIVTIPGEGWYDQLETITLTAPPVNGYDFQNWDVDGVSQGAGTSTINIQMNTTHTATAHYSTQVKGWYAPWWLYWLLLPFLLLAIITLIALLYYRRRKKKSQAFYRGWTAWYYHYDVPHKTRII